MPHDEATSRLRAALVPYIGVELPDSFRNRFDEMLTPLQVASNESADGRRRNDVVVNVYEGMLAVQYHRERVSIIERETVERVRKAFPGTWHGRETFIGIKMSTLGFEYVAYLNACRRTLDYVALAVAALFLRPGGSIKRLAKTVTDAEPHDLSTQVVRISADVHDRFPRLLSREETKSPRDRAAHRQPVEAAALGVSLRADGVRVALHDSGVGNLSPVTAIEQMGTNPPLAAVRRD